MKDNGISTIYFPNTAVFGGKPKTLSLIFLLKLIRPGLCTYHHHHFSAPVHSWRLHSLLANSLKNSLYALERGVREEETGEFMEDTHVKL